MKLELPPLPYAKNELEPHMSRETVELHYEKHHRGYLNKLQSLIADKPEADRTLEALVRSSSGPVYNNAAQVWNHTFFWDSMTPRGGGKPSGEIARLIDDGFQSFEYFRERWIDVGEARFGSGYVWLVLDGERLRCIDTHDADNPLTMGRFPLLTCDVWEHAYYVDHRHERARYLATFLDHLVNWEFIEERLDIAHAAMLPREI
jgi:superoxide dismutase, Fe-Mn family